MGAEAGLQRGAHEGDARGGWRRGGAGCLVRVRVRVRVRGRARVRLTLTLTLNPNPNPNLPRPMPAATARLAAAVASFRTRRRRRLLLRRSSVKRCRGALMLRGVHRLGRRPLGYGEAPAVPVKRHAVCLEPHHNVHRCDGLPAGEGEGEGEGQGSDSGSGWGSPYP